MSVFNGKVGINLRLSAIPVIFQTIKKSVFISLLSLVLSLTHSHMCARFVRIVRVLFLLSCFHWQVSALFI